MSPQSDWVPARAPLRADVLDRLRAGPVNCLVVEWPGADAVMVRRARDAGFAVVGDAGAAKDPRAAAASARAAGLSAAIGPAELAGDFVIPGAALTALPRTGEWQTAVVRECAWPGIRAGSRGDADAGPTGAPWIDSNGWIARLARGLAPGKSIWLDFAPAADAVVGVDQWLLAAADACVYGARWVLPAAALQPGVWPAVSRALAFFASRREWPGETVSPAAVISDFAGDNEFLAHELLNLTARRQLPLRILEQGRASGIPWNHVSAIIYTDAQPPERALLARILEAVRGGALLVAPPHFAKIVQGADAGEPPCPGYRMLAAGKGRVAIATQAWEDPFLLAADVQNLMGRRNAPVRLWNGGTTIPFPTGRTAERARIVHLVKYTSRSREAVTLGLPERYRAARFHTFENAATPLQAHAARRGVEFYLPPFRVYGAVELED